MRLCGDALTRQRGPRQSGVGDFWKKNVSGNSAINKNITNDRMKLSNPSAVPVYTISGSATARPLPEWLARQRKRSLKQDPEWANRVELLQDFEFEEASQCVRVSDDGEWVMSTGRRFLEEGGE